MRGCSQGGGGMRGCLGGVHGCLGGWGACVIALVGCVWLLPGGACMVAPGGVYVVAPQGHAWLLWGGMHGCSGGRGACVRYDEIRRYGQRAGILLECILVSNYFQKEESIAHRQRSTQTRDPHWFTRSPKEGYQRPTDVIYFLKENGENVVNGTRNV